MAKQAQSTLRADLVIIGGGGSGLTAAVAALEKGVKRIVILEKRNRLGGNAIFPGGLLATDTHIQRRLGMDASTDSVFRQAMYYGHWKNNGRLVRALVDKSADTIRWLENKGIKFERIITHYPNQFPNTYHAAAGPETTGAQIVGTFGKICEKSGVRILNNTPAVKILTDRANKVSGVLAKTKSGEEFRINTRCVIITTGGFSGNEKLIKKYDPSYDKKLVPPRGTPHNGDGLRMAEEIGADLDGMVVYEWEAFVRGSIFLTVLARRQSVMWVNRNGERFCDEGIPLAIEATNAIGRQPGKVVYALFDEKLKDKMLAEELTPFEAFFVKGEAKDVVWTSFQEAANRDLKTGKALSEIKISNSIGEIAKWMGVKPGILETNISEYNSFCDHGRDAVFAKDAVFLQPVRNPPYYAFKFGVSLTMTHGGIKVNHRMEVMNKDEHPIPGLYAAGVETGAKDWDSYNMWLAGHSFGYTINGGRIAGEEAAKYVLNK